MIQDHQPVTIKEFNGIFDMDSFKDSVPLGYFADELNTITSGDEVRTRDGFASSHTTPSVVRFAIFRRQGEASRILVLDSSGNLKDLTTATTILSIAAMTDFAIGFSNNRAYISPHNGIAGLPGEFVYVYTGVGTARKAAGNIPSGSSTAVISATAGIIEAGTHIFAWVYETTTGFVTAPGPAQTLSFDGTKAVDFSNIPVGPAGTATRRLIASRAIQDYNGNEEGYEMFFVPGGKINNNVDTTLADVDFFDAELVDTADYAYDQLAEIPAVVFISPYGERLCFGGPDTDKNLVYISKNAEPESISSVAGFISCDPHETEGVKDATEFRDNFYITKANHTYVTKDNGYEPSTWRVLDLDQAIGADINGIAQYLGAKGARVEFFLVADKSGLYKFSGVYEEIALTRNIKRIWERITQAHFNKVQVVIDQKRLLIYILVPLDGAVSPNYILVGNFENGFNSERIKWHVWGFASLVPSSIATDTDNTTKKTTLRFGSLSGNIYGQEEDRRNDAGVAISNYIEFAKLAVSQNAINHMGYLKLRIKGSGVITVDLYGQDNIDFATMGTFTLAATPGKELERACFFQTERIGIKISLNAVGSYLKLRQVTPYINEIFATRPA